MIKIQNNKKTQVTKVLDSEGKEIANLKKKNIKNPGANDWPVHFQYHKKNWKFMTDWD